LHDFFIRFTICGMANLRAIGSTVSITRSKEVWKMSSASSSEHPALRSMFRQPARAGAYACL
jgi:hypothetical protein